MKTLKNFPLDNTTIGGGGDIQVNSNDRSENNLHPLDISLLYGCISQRRME